MSELSHFEKHEVTPQPPIDFKSVLEKGEIESAETLEGFFPVKIVTIKDDGKALFRPNGFRYEGLENREELRTELELLVASVDEVLEFGLVPPTVQRDLENKRGTFQKFIEDAEIAEHHGVNWPEIVAESEIIKAAVFDFLINAQDRCRRNFLVNPDSKKIWLIDHDWIMLIRSGHPSLILTEAIKRNLTKLPREVVESIQRLYDKTNFFSSTSINPMVQEIFLGIKNRAEVLLERGQIPAINT